ncbi:sugar transferase [Demequina sp. SO4-13]|uniref:sugar transferase n=1 Tax=Demequina sp. SO4-13 TaxID=3401027 RepID=UPI003AF72F7E
MIFARASIRDEASSERMGGKDGWSLKYERRLFLTDAFVVAVVMVLAHAVRFGWDPVAPVSGTSAPTYWLVSLAIAVLWILQLGWARSREARILGHGPQEFQRVINASWLTFAIVAIVGFLTQWQISRGYLLFAIPVGTATLVLYRAAWRHWVHAQRDSGELQAQVLVVGPVRTVEQMVRRLNRARRAGLHVVGVATPPGLSLQGLDEVLGVPYVGQLDNAVDQARAVGAELILLAGNDAMSLAESRRLGWSLEGTEIGLIVAPSLVDVAGPRVQMSPVEGLPLMYVETPTFSGLKYWVKALFDRTIAAALLLISALPMAVIAVVVRLSSPGPVLFRQQRVGQNMHPFAMLKFRSMHVDAEERLEDLLETNESDGALFKMRNDPRVTGPGRYLRRFSLDELPQLINVLKGQMSMVGPRPPLPREIEQWDERVGRRQLVKPGITGLWQVSGRSDLPWDQAVLLDLYYTENWSLGGDLVIMFRTFLAVFAKRGAY